MYKRLFGTVSFVQLVARLPSTQSRNYWFIRSLRPHPAQPPVSDTESNSGGIGPVDDLVLEKCRWLGNCGAASKLLWSDCRRYEGSHGSYIGFHEYSDLFLGRKTASHCMQSQVRFSQCSGTSPRGSCRTL